MINPVMILKKNILYWKIGILSAPSFFRWIRAGFRGPAPHFVKMSFLRLAHDVDVWIETGTYLGQTTRKLSTMGNRVISIEPSEEFATNAGAQLASLTNIQIVNALSEDVLEQIVSSIEQSKEKNIAFWLDGHFSAGNTFLGPVETPIESELKIISSHLEGFDTVWVFVDDFRCFVQASKDYPSPSVLVDWASQHNLSWTIENDIFLATNAVL